MKSKGFTLIEIIVSVALLAAVGITIGVNISGMFKAQEEREIKSFNEKLEAAADIYLYRNPEMQEQVFLENDVTIRVAQLINEGLITAKLKDPSTDKAVSANKEITYSYNSADKELKFIIN